MGHTMQQPVERAFRVMGCSSHVVIHGGDEHLLDIAEARLRELESWWSRFRDDSDITIANRAAGLPVVVHPDTLAVVSRALDAWRQTEGHFDITVLPALLDVGYTHSAVDQSAAPSVPGSRVGMSAWVRVDYDRSTLTVPAQSAIDLGGIGKGFAADIVAEELIEQGATGALVNVGGDLRTAGRPVDDESWYLGIEDPLRPPEHLAFLRLQEGGIATSGTTIRTWTDAQGRTVHHLIDPATGRPADHQVLTATVLAADAATAEAFATAAMMMPASKAVAMLDRLGLAGLVVDTAGQSFRSGTFAAFEPPPAAG
jgi:thiamine biosynthesis lipoprotein